MFIQKLVSVSNQLVGIVTEWRHILKYAGLNTEIFSLKCFEV